MILCQEERRKKVRSMKKNYSKNRKKQQSLFSKSGKDIREVEDFHLQRL